MRKLILYIFLAAFLATLASGTAYAAVPCQAIYGGGEVCSNQPNTIVQKGYPVTQPTPTPTPIQFTIPQTRTLPSTGTNIWSLLLIGLSGVGGVVLLLL